MLGIDPGQRTGCKCVVVDDTGKLLTHALIQLVGGAAALEQAKKTLGELLKKYRPFAIAVGNGTHGRETADFAARSRRSSASETLVVLVSEAGASVYSASDVAREEFPDLDLTVRGAVSIARRLQDPLAELVKIDPKAIGVGQYQHDVQPALLLRKLDEVVESCVNAVGVELNTASAPLLSRVAGVGPALAKKIVAYREKAGAFRSRRELLKVGEPRSEGVRAGRGLRPDPRRLEPARRERGPSRALCARGAHREGRRRRRARARRQRRARREDPVVQVRRGRRRATRRSRTSAARSRSRAATRATRSRRRRSATTCARSRT